MGGRQVCLEVYGADVGGVGAVRFAVDGTLVEGGALAARRVHCVQVHHRQRVVQYLWEK